MAYRPYPNAARALRQLDRHAQPFTPLPPWRVEMAQQANETLAVAGAAVRPFIEGAVLRAAEAPRLLRLDQTLIALGAALEQECARSAPGVLLMYRMAQGMRRPA